MRETATRFDGRLAVVTGAASGIGRATARAFAERGAGVLALDRDGTGLRALAGGSITTVVADLRRPEAIRALLAGMPEIGVLANVAGNYAAGGLVRAGAAPVEDLFAINVTALSLLTGQALPLLESAGGAVVNVASTVGHRACPSAPCYAASKAAVEQLTRCWARELAPHRIRVNAIAPGPVDTPILSRAGMPADAIAAQRRAERQRIPLSRLGRPEEIAGWIVALAAPGSWVTGRVVSVDGGLSCV